ncbi:putative tetraheme cytochrome-c type [Gammaproteobacteria bacterium]
MTTNDAASQETGKSIRKWIIFGAVVFLFTVILVSGFNVGLESTNTTEFCTSCHSMQVNLKELQESKTHWNNRSGVHAGCPNCHVPKSFWPKMQAKIMASKDLFHEIMGTTNTPEKYEAHRQAMAENVWAKMKETDSRECRGCHSFQHMSFTEQSRSARKKHEGASERGQTCIDCHKGLVHKMPDAPTSEDEGDGGKPASKEK